MISAISSGCPGRPAGVFSRKAWSASGGLPVIIGVSIMPGASALIRMPAGAYSTAWPRSMLIHSAFEAV